MFRAYDRLSPEQEPMNTSPLEEEHLRQWHHHVQVAKDAREGDNADLRQARKTRDLRRQGTLPLEGYVAHDTVDFMQSLAVPQCATHTKEMYSFSLRKIHLFSIRDDGARTQYNSIYDEGDGGKGATSVMSMLFHFLRHRTQETAAIVMHLHADNCCGHHKNNLVMPLLVLLVGIGCLKHVAMTFLIKGHTHCSVDGGHGIIKKAWRHRDVFTIEQAAKVIEETSPIAGIHHAIILSPKDFFDWEAVLSTYVNKLPKILSCHQGEMDSTRGGILRYRRYSTDAWLDTQLLTQGAGTIPAELSSIEALQEALPPLTPPGMTKKKQKVLYEKVRKYVPAEYQDVICPPPEEYQKLQAKRGKDNTQ